MAKRLTEKEKEEIVKNFTLGKSIEDLSKDFKCTSLTITRNLKSNLGEKKYKKLIEQNKTSIKLPEKNKKTTHLENNTESFSKTSQENSNECFSDSPFIELTPIDYVIDNAKQKDLSSVPISEFEFPKIVYMIVDKRIELEIKYLKDFPAWDFLSKDELNRKTIEIFFDLKNAKKFCNKEQKVIKVPNTNVFRIVAHHLLSRGISRIVSSDKLIAL